MSRFDELPNKLLFVWLQLQCVEGRERRGVWCQRLKKGENKDFQASVD